jgi:hypothetical protein
MKNPLPISRRGLYSLVDGVNLHLICPTSQARDGLLRQLSAFAALGSRVMEQKEETAHV